MVEAITGARDTKALLVQAQTVITEVQNALDNEVAKDAKEHYRVMARDWTQTPRFKSELRNRNRNPRATSAKPLILRVYPDVSGSGASPEWTFHWTDKGTKPHTITARRAPTLKFRTDYKPKTRFRAITGGPGIATGEFRSPVTVNHPGTKARDFSGKLLENYKHDYTHTRSPK